MTKYKFTIKGSNFKLLTSDAADLAARLPDRIGSCGIAYLRDGSNEVVLVSNSQHDILDAFARGEWCTTKRVIGAVPGTRVYLIPNREVAAKYGQGAIGAQFVVDSTHEDNDKLWTSEVV